MQNTTAQQGDLREYVDVIRTRKWTILFVFLLVLGAALFRSYRQTPLYLASTRLLVAGVPTDSTGAVPLPQMTTEAEVVQSVEVAEVAKGLLRVNENPDSLLGGLSVSQVGDTQVLTISYTSSDPQYAADAANAFARGYVTFKQEGARESLEPVIENLQTRLTRTRTALERVENQLERAESINSPDPETVSRLDQKRVQTQSDLDLLEERLQTALSTETSIALGGGDVLQPANTPRQPTSPDHRTNGVIGGIFGILLGLAAGFTRDRLDQRFRSRAEAERLLVAPVLATIPKFKVPKRAGSILGYGPRSSAAESYRTLRTNLQFLAGQREVKSIVVTSASSHEGKSLTAANLAVAFGQVGRKVVLVSADMRRPGVEKHFGLAEHSIGLSSWLSGSTNDLRQVVVDTQSENVFLLPSGPIPENPAELLASTRLDELIEQLGRHFDYVLFDSVPTLALADAAIVAARADAAILVIDASATSRQAAMHSKVELERVGASILGVILNKFEVVGSPYYYYNYKASKPSSGSGNGSGNGAGPQAVAAGRKSRFGRRR